MTDPTPPSRTPDGRILRIALVLSLALNLLVLGLVLGASFGRDRERGRDTVQADVGFYPFIAALPREDRRALGAAVAGRAGDLRQNREELRRQFDMLLTALRSEPFDSEAARAAVSAQQARLNERQDIGRELLIDRLAAMTAAERAAYADALEEEVRHPRRRSRHR